MNTPLQTPPIPEDKHWLLGNVPGLMKDLLGYLDEIRSYGKIVHLTAPVASGQMYVVYDPEVLEHILVKNNRNYTKGNFGKIAKPLLGNGLVPSEGDFWKKQRRLMQPVFYKESMKKIMLSINASIEQLINEWQTNYEDGAAIDLTTEFNKLALRVISSSLFHLDIDDKIPIISRNLAFVTKRMMKRFKDPVTNAIWLPTIANFREKACIMEIFSIIEDIIAQKRSGKISNEGDILDMLMALEDADTAEKMSDEQLRDELVNLVIAGHETTAQAMSFMMYLLCEHPEVVKKLKAAYAALGKNPSLEQIRNISYAQHIVKETLRLFPPGVMIQRQAQEPDQYKNFYVPAKMNVLMPIYVIHHMEEYWKDAHRFKPERFEPENLKSVPKFAYFPFGGGQRMCIGDQFAITEMVLAMVKILENFTFKNEVNYTPEIEVEMAIRPKEHVVLNIYKKNSRPVQHQAQNYSAEHVE